MRLAAAIVLVLLAALPARAHVTELAVLEIRALGGDGTYAVRWEKKPSTDLGAQLSPIFPPHCTHDAPILDCGADGLHGRLGFEGIGAGRSAAIFKIQPVSGPTQVITLTPAQPTADVARNHDASSFAGRVDILAAYLQIGVEHILLGVDHLLFVLGLIWISRGRWMLLKTITAFTVAHSVTLGAVTFGHVGVPETFVNALIALSIVFIGVEMLNARDGRQTWTLRFPWAVSFAFGLLHGFGFANALVSLGLPEGAIPLALVAFNLGVEVGQIGFVLVVLALGWAYGVMRVAWPGWARVAPAYAIGGIAAFWFIQRVETLIGA